MLLVSRARTLPGSGLPELVDIEVADGIITAIRPPEDGPLPGALDADGAVVIPGLWDTHVHLTHHAPSPTPSTCPAPRTRTRWSPPCGGRSAGRTTG